MPTTLSKWSPKFFSSITAEPHVGVGFVRDQPGHRYETQSTSVGTIQKEQPWRQTRIGRS